MSSEKTQPVNISREFLFSAEKIFDAWLKPGIMRQWLFVSQSNKIINIDVDEKVGGKFSILEESETGEQIEHYGKYIWIDRPRELIFTLEVPKHFPGITYVTVKIAPTPNGCQLNFTQTGVPREVTETNWRDMLDRLQEILSEP